VPVQTKSIYDPPMRKDGLRVLVTRYWPRGVSRDAVSSYVSALAPSRDLLRTFKDHSIGWREFATGYRHEMQGDEPRREIEHLAHTAASRKVTLLCTCREDVQCHRSLLRDIVEAQMTAVP